MESLVSVAEFSLRVLKAGARHYLVVLASILVCVAISLAYAMARGPLYSSTMTVRAADNNDGSAALKRLASLGGIGGLGGGGLLPAYMDLLQSNQVASLLMSREHFEQRLFGERLNSDGTWRRGILGRLKGSVFSVFGIVAHAKPTVTDVKNALTDMLVVNQDAQSGLVTVGCTSSRIELCRDLLLAVHRQAEYSLAQTQYEQAIRTRDYIVAKLATSTQIETRESLAEPLADAQAHIAMGGLDRPNAAQIIEAPVAPDEPSFPKPLTIALFAFLAGIAIGLAIAVRLDNKAMTLGMPWQAPAAASS